MTTENEQLPKIEALLAGAGSPRELGAADAALERVTARLAEQARRDPPIEMQFSMPDSWSRQLFVALCRRYGLQPFRFRRQKRTTVVLRVPRGFSDTLLWPEFLELDRALRARLQGVTTRIIHDAIHADTAMPRRPRQRCQDRNGYHVTTSEVSRQGKSTWTAPSLPPLTTA